MSGIILEDELNQSRYTGIIQKVLALVAATFGMLTIIAGTRALSGSDPGYVVFRPLLIYNTTMGIFYVAVGFMVWRNINQGKYAAGIIFILNFLVLGVSGYLYTVDNVIAIESLGAMILRTIVWFVLSLGLVWLNRTNIQADNA